MVGCIENEVSGSVTHLSTILALGCLTTVRGDFWTHLVEILMSPSLVGYMLTSSCFSLLNRGMFYTYIYNDW